MYVCMLYSSTVQYKTRQGRENRRWEVFVEEELRKYSRRIRSQDICQQDVSR